MKNKLQPTRTSFSRKFQCKKASRWLSKFFHFGTENRADQLKKPPCRIAHSKYETRQVRYRANCIKHTMIHKYLAREKYDNIPYIAQYTQLIPKSLKPPPGGSAHTAKPMYFVLTCVKICISWTEYKLPVARECRLYGFCLPFNMTSFSWHTGVCSILNQ